MSQLVVLTYERFTRPRGVSSVRTMPITVQRASNDEYRVVVEEGGSRTRHNVTATADHLADLGLSVMAEEVILASFEFLLEREPKESILSSFELPIIGRYFPEYPAEIRRRLSR